MFWLAAVYSIFLNCTRRGCGRISLRTQLVWWRHLAVHLQYLCVTNGLIFFGALWYTRTHAQIQSAREVYVLKIGGNNASKYTLVLYSLV